MNRIQDRLRQALSSAGAASCQTAVVLGLALAVGTTVVSPAQAALIDRGGGMVYDTVQDLTWLADWNFAQTQGADADGRMSWLDANAWANGLVHGGFDDWRLPVIRPGDPGCSEVIPDAGFGPQHYGYGCSQGEMGHLFYVDAGAMAGEPLTSGDPAVLALFQNLQMAPYWMRNESEPTPVNAWYFHIVDGGQFTADKDDLFAAVAVRAGDVLALRVPEPGSLLLTLMAAAAAAGVGRGAAGKGSGRRRAGRAPA